jgi:hypothetical protein
MHARRLVDHPIISPDSHHSLGTNINGPSLVRVPDWVDGALGTYYLYFADHRGDHIRLAHGDALEGPWRVHPGGVIGLEQSHFLTAPPDAPPDDVDAALAFTRELLGDHELPPGFIHDLTAPHIASPDVRIDHEGRSFEMAFHGLEALGLQLTRFAHSDDGLGFVVHPEPIDGAYLRAFDHGGREYAITMPGRIHRRVGPTEFESGPDVFPKSARHSAVRVVGDRIQIFWTRVGDAPERILVSEIDASRPWTEWKAGEAHELLRPEREWEGAALPLEPSRRSLAPGPVNQLRDPAVFEDGGRCFVVYAVAGESGLGIAEVVD